MWSNYGPAGQQLHTQIQLVRTHSDGLSLLCFLLHPPFPFPSPTPTPYHPSLHRGGRRNSFKKGGGVLLRQNRRDVEQKGKKRYPLQHIKWVNLVMNENLAPESTGNREKIRWYSLRYRCGGLRAQWPSGESQCQPDSGLMTSGWWSTEGHESSGGETVLSL